MPSLLSRMADIMPPAVVWNGTEKTRIWDRKPRVFGKHKTYSAPKKGLVVLGF